MMIVANILCVILIILCVMSLCLSGDRRSGAQRAELPGVGGGAGAGGRSRPPGARPLLRPHRHPPPRLPHPLPPRPSHPKNSFVVDTVQRRHCIIVGDFMKLPLLSRIQRNT